MTNEERMNRLTERVGHPDTMRPLSAIESEWLDLALEFLCKAEQDTALEWLDKEASPYK